METITQPPQSKQEQPIVDLNNEVIRASKRFVGEFTIDDRNEKVINALLFYFTNNKVFNTLPPTVCKNPNLNKGLLLMGNVGSGKTLLMRIFSLLTNNSYSIVPCLDAAIKYASKGYDSLLPYYEKHYCFDDLGAEGVQKHYGNELQVMTVILDKRYNRFITHGQITFITTNLTGDQIKEYYGERVYSRLKEMCNSFVLGNGQQALDRRTNSVPAEKANKPTIQLQIKPENSAYIETERKKGSYESLVKFYNEQNKFPDAWGWWDCFQYLKKENLQSWEASDEKQLGTDLTNEYTGRLESIKLAKGADAYREEYRRLFGQLEVAIAEQLIKQHIQTQNL